MCSTSIALLVEHSKTIMDKWENTSFKENPDDNINYDETKNTNAIRLNSKIFIQHEKIERVIGIHQMKVDSQPEENHIGDNSVETAESDANDISSINNKQDQSDTAVDDDAGVAENNFEASSEDEFEYEYEDAADEEDEEDEEYEYEYVEDDGNDVEIEEIDTEPQFIVIDWEMEKKNEIEIKEIQDSDEEYNETQTKVDRGPEDVTFIVGYTNAKISAHKNLLCNESEVFQQLFADGKLKEIKVPDADPNDFKTFLKCLYTTKQRDISMISDIDEAFEISYLANKYKIARLVDKARAAIQQLIDCDTATTILQRATIYKDDELSEIAFEFICKNTNDVFQSKTFTQLSHDNLCRLLEQDSLTIDELPLFNAVFRWAVAFLNRKVMDGKADILRNALAEPLHLIRFNLMSLEDFVTYVCETSVLTAEKQKGICDYLSLPPSERNVEDLSAYLFKTNSRYALYIPRDCYVVQRIARCDSSVLGDDTYLYSKNAWGFSFETNLPIYIVSVGLYGPKGETSIDCRVKIEVIEFVDRECTKIISETEVENEHRIRQNIFHVPLAKPVKIVANKMFIIRFQILQGPPVAICTGAAAETKTLCKNGQNIAIKYGDYCHGLLTTTNQLPELMIKLAHN